MQDREVRLELLVDRRRHADQHEVGGVQRLDPIGQHEAVVGQVRVQVAALTVEQLRLTGADRVQPFGGDVDADDPAAGVAHRDRRRQPDVAEPDDGDDGVSGLRAAGAALRRGAAPAHGRALRRRGT